MTDLTDLIHETWDESSTRDEFIDKMSNVSDVDYDTLNALGTLLEQGVEFDQAVYQIQPNIDAFLKAEYGVE